MGYLSTVMGDVVDLIDMTAPYRVSPAQTGAFYAPARPLSVPYPSGVGGRAGLVELWAIVALVAWQLRCCGVTRCDPWVALVREGLARVARAL